MVDENLDVWLLEVNVSPDVSHSTDITADLVPRATHDTLNRKFFIESSLFLVGALTSACLVVLNGDSSEEDSDWELLEGLSHIH